MQFSRRLAITSSVECLFTCQIKFTSRIRVHPKAPNTREHGTSRLAFFSIGEDACLHSMDCSLNFAQDLSQWLYGLEGITPFVLPY
ncbi:hypothetical protein TNCT_634311 [Trichonephila clavata]|uniref:Uncharacterized protein n=1 Tax=Trichonephila clavata TaxID=2740835 RepID=A0A8X6KBA5_TRICU|nr:hypothetical protein TNCT_634311 [Trichonephila clavata]